MLALLAALVLVLVSGCATQPPPSPLGPGFLAGLLHGLGAPVAFVISLLTDDMRVYAFPRRPPEPVRLQPGEPLHRCATPGPRAWSRAGPT